MFYKKIICNKINAELLKTTKYKPFTSFPKKNIQVFHRKTLVNIGLSGQEGEYNF
jgi:hypothetical protein